MIGDNRPPRTSPMGVVIAVVSYNSGYERSINTATSGTICIVRDNGTQASGPWTEEMVFRSHRDDVDDFSRALAEFRAMRNHKGAYVLLLPGLFIGPALECPRWSATEWRPRDPAHRARLVRQVTGATGK